MDILLLCYEYPPLGGGGGVGARKYCEAWARNGHSVTVVTGGGAGLPATETIAGVRVHRVATLGKKQRATATFTYMASYLLCGAWFLTRHRDRFRGIDVINTHFSFPTGPLGWFAARLLRRPNVLTIIGGDIHDPTKRSSPHRVPLLRQINRLLMQRADRVVAISSDTRRRAVELYGVTRPIEVINYGFEATPSAQPEIEERSGSGDDTFWLVGVGRLVARKGFAHLIDALALLPPQVRLRLVGDGPDEASLRARASAAGVADRVEFLGFRNAGEVERVLSRSDCFVLSSLHEGLGIVVQEAMHAGLPIVSTDNGGQVDLVQHGWNGLLVPPADAAALAAAIEMIWKDPVTARAMGRRSRERLVPLYMDQNSEEYLELFRECVAGAAVPGDRWAGQTPEPTEPLPADKVR